MVSILPAPGRSRFSKALPPPPPPANLNKPQPQPMKTSVHSPLPPLPPPKMTMAIPRRPVGGPSQHAKMRSVDSASSTYSDTPGFSRSTSTGSYQTKDSLNAVDSALDTTPPLPPKDNESENPLQIPLASPISNLNYSPPGPELWRRRSQKSDKGIAFAELNLSKSNGSTANPTEKEQPARSLPSQLPRSQGRKPLPVGDIASTLEQMGNKLSKLKLHGKDDKKGSKEHKGELKYTTNNVESPGQKRLPTPEYVKNDVQQPLTPRVISPETPPNEYVSPVELTPPIEHASDTPRRSDSQTTTTDSRREPDISSLAPSTDAALAQSTVPSSFVSTHSREPSDTLTITSQAPIRTPQPQKTVTTSFFTSQLSPTTNSPQVSPILPSPHNVVNGLPRFPTLPSPAPPGTVLPGAPLDVTHFECYQAHRYMRSSRNELCPVACMVCQKREGGQRWRCAWCCLSACGSCMKALNSVPGNDLKACLRRIGR
jgi:hypothetical protein